MNLILILFLILLIFTILIISAVLLFFKTKAGPSLDNLLAEELGAIKTQINNLVSSQSGFQDNLNQISRDFLKTTSDVKDKLSGEISETKRIIDIFKTDYESRKDLEKNMQLSVQKIVEVFAGSRSRGASGERVLEEAFKMFPAGMIDYNFRVKGKPVEYALILSNNKRLPIDSKWPAMDLLAQINEAADPLKQQELEEEIEKQLLRKVREVTQYIDPVTTLPFALAAVPDAVMAVCKKAHVEAYRNQVILMAYSMTIPYILALYKMHLEYARSIDLENLEGYLSQIETHLNKIDQVLENSVSRGATMVANAYSDCKKFLGEIRGSLAYLKSLPENKEKTEFLREAKD